MSQPKVLFPACVLVLTSLASMNYGIYACFHPPTSEYQELVHQDDQATFYHRRRRKPKVVEQLKSTTNLMEKRTKGKCNNKKCNGHWKYYNRPTTSQIHALGRVF